MFGFKCEMRYVIDSPACTLTHTIMSQRSAGEFIPLFIADKIGGRNLLDQGGDAAYAVVLKSLHRMPSYHDGLGQPRLRSQRLQPIVIANYLMISLEGPTQFGLFKLPAFE